MLYQYVIMTILAISLNFVSFSKNMSNHSLLTETESPLPLYHRLYIILKEQIKNGIFAPGTTLPSEADLTQQYGVSRITAKRALDELALEGLVQRSRGKGTIVRDDFSKRVIQTPVQANIQGLMTNLDNIKKNTTIKINYFDYIQANDWVSKQLHLQQGSIVQKATRIRHINKVPFSKSTSYIPEQIGRSFTKSDLLNNALIDLLKSTGNEPTRVEQVITCTLVDDNDAKDLQILVGGPLLKFRRIFFNKEGSVVNYQEILYSPDHFEYTMSLTVVNE